MLVLYVACNPTEDVSLMVEREITELQRRFLTAQGEPAELRALPSLPVEELPLELEKHRPDVLHISAHGDTGELTFANSSGHRVTLTASMLLRWLDTERPPRLVFLNACNSREIARKLVRVVPMAVGMTAPIHNRGALAAALLFYDRLLSGHIVRNAVEACKASLEALHHSAASCELYRAGKTETENERLYQVPRIVARFAEDDASHDKDGFFSVEIGVLGCPGNTSQVVFFTDDSSFIDSDEDDDEDYHEAFLASQLCRVVRDVPIRNVIWSTDEEWIYGDYRLFAAGITGAGSAFTVSSTLCDALEAYYRFGLADGRPSEVPDKWRTAIGQLRSLDGARGPSAASSAGADDKKPGARGSGTEKRAATAKRVSSRKATSAGRKKAMLRRRLRRKK